MICDSGSGGATHPCGTQADRSQKAEVIEGASGVLAHTGFSCVAFGGRGVDLLSVGDGLHKNLGRIAAGAGGKDEDGDFGEGWSGKR